MRTVLNHAWLWGAVAVGLGVLVISATADDKPAAATKVYELRVYTTNPGKLEALHTRFRDHTCKLFQKHGIELVGFWTPTEGEQAKDTLVYIVAFPARMPRSRPGRRSATIPSGRKPRPIRRKTACWSSP